MKQNNNSGGIAAATAILSILIAGATLFLGDGILLPFLPNSSTPKSTQDPTESPTCVNNTSYTDGTIENPAIEIQQSNIETDDNSNKSITPCGDIISSRKGRILSIQNGGSIAFSNVSFSQNGLAYTTKYDECTTSTHIGYGFVLYGNFEYSNNITVNETTTWQHGGTLLDMAGNICYTENTLSSSSLDGMVFAVDLPEDIIPGVYKYCLTHYVNNLTLVGIIEFEVLN